MGDKTKTPAKTKPKTAKKQTKAKKKKITYVLDTNILVQAPSAIFSFDEHDVIITDITIEELDGLKSAPGEVGANAREAVSTLDALREMGNILGGVKLPSGGIFKVETNHVSEKLPDGWAEDKADNRILRTCKALGKTAKSGIVLVSNDMAMRLKADIIGVAAEEYRTDKSPDVNEQYKGRRVLDVPGSMVDAIKEDGLFLAEDLPKGALDGGPLVDNEYILLACKADESRMQAAKTIVGGQMIRCLEYSDIAPCGITPRNTGQKFAIEALYESASEIPLVILKGSAGTAKTFCALAVGLDRAILGNKYKRMLLVRPSAEFDDDIGFLPGDEQSKIGPLLRPAMDNLEILAGNLKNTPLYNSLSREHGKDMTAEIFIRELFDKGLLQAQAMNFMRGRSIVDTYIIVDEAQNMTPLQAMGLITRAGEGTKIVLAGDTAQIDNPRLDSRTNGLSYTSEMMKGSPLCAQVTFEGEECTRSPLAMESASRMIPKGSTVMGNKR